MTCRFCSGGLHAHVVRVGIVVVALVARKCYSDGGVVV